MEQTKSELDLAWEEVTFWQDFVINYKAEHDRFPEPRVLDALENAWRRYERALLDLKRPTAL